MATWNRVPIVGGPEDASSTHVVLTTYQLEQLDQQQQHLEQDSPRSNASSSARSRPGHQPLTSSRNSNCSTTGPAPAVPLSSSLALSATTTTTLMASDNAGDFWIRQTPLKLGNVKQLDQTQVHPQRFKGRFRRWPGVLLFVLLCTTVTAAIVYGACKAHQDMQNRTEKYNQQAFEDSKIKYGHAGHDGIGDIISPDGQIGNPTEYPPETCELPDYISQNGKLYAVATNGSRINLQIKGVNWFGMETGEAIPYGLWDNDENGTTAYQIAAFLSYNKFNAVRLPLCADSIVTNATPNKLLMNLATNRALDPSDYLSMVQSIVKVLQYRRIGVVLSMHTLTPTNNGALWYDTDFPESRFLQAIDKLTSALCTKEYWNVMGIDLKNEPYKATWGTGEANDFRLGAQRIANRMLQGCPQWLGFIEGLNYESHQVVIGGESFTYNDWYGGGLQNVGQYPVEFDVPNKVVFAPHYYTPAVFPQLYLYGGGTRNPVDLTLQNYVELDNATLRQRVNGTMYDMFGYLGANQSGPAVLLGEFGGLYSTDKHPEKTTQRTTDLTIQMIHDQNLAGGFMWSLNPESKYQYNPADVGGPVATFPEGLVNADWVNANQFYLQGLEAMDGLLPNLRPFPCFSNVSNDETT